jgi:hypothetical protein
MKTAVLISCAAQKLPYKATAQDLYTSPPFKKSLHYARSLKPDHIFILSAKYGLLRLDQVIEPYDVTLNDMPAAEIRRWSWHVLDQLRALIDLHNDRVIFLAGGKYRKYLVPAISTYAVPMQGLSIGQQLHFRLFGSCRKQHYKRFCLSLKSVDGIFALM